MLYRENGQFKVSYAEDQQILPIVQDRWFMLALLAFAYLVMPAIASDYMFLSLVTPFLILAIAAIGLNILVGYCGQISLGTAAFMAVGAYAGYNLVIRVPALNFIVVLVLSGGIAALFGILFGIPSLRIKGFTWRWRRWRRSSSSTGCSRASSGSPTIRRPGRSRRRRSRCSAGRWTPRSRSTCSFCPWQW